MVYQSLGKCFDFFVLFADDINMFITGKYMNVLCRQLNKDLKNIQAYYSVIIYL